MCKNVTRKSLQNIQDFTQNGRKLIIRGCQFFFFMTIFYSSNTCQRLTYGSLLLKYPLYRVYSPLNNSPKFNDKTISRSVLDIHTISAQKTN